MVTGERHTHSLCGTATMPLQTYGFEHLFTLTNLEKIGLLKQKMGACQRVDVDRGRLEKS